MSALTIERLAGEPLERANALYTSIDFEPSVEGRDETYGIFEADEPVALGRAQRYADGAVEIGGFWVHERHRRRGLARRMAARVLEHVPTGADVWCLPFAHLVDFYREFGFERAGERRDVPASIRRKTSLCLQRESEGVYRHVDLLVRIAPSR